MARSLVATIAVLALATSAAEAAKFKVLHSFCESHHRVCGDGSNPAGPLVVDAVGNFFGTTATGGFGLGTVFELARKPNGNFNFKTLYRFCSQATCGGNPNGALVIDTQGNLYGTATDIVFELSPGGKRGLWTEKVLYRFCSQQNCADGENAVGSLTYAGVSSGAPYDGISPLYGVTNLGGANNGGTVFQLTNNSGSWTQTVLYDFCSTGGDKCTDGAEPAAGPIMDGAGNLYGTTVVGGGNDLGKSNQGTGTVFELLPNGDGTWMHTVLYRFCALANCADGAYPGVLIMNSTGALLGPAGAGGTASGGAPCINAKSYGCGAIFKLIPNGELSQESAIYSFCAMRDCKDGWEPGGAVVLDPSENLFGVTRYGGGNDIDHLDAGAGTVYKISGTSLKTLHRFCSLANCADGEYPYGGLVEDVLGRLYGSASSDEVHHAGTIFRLKP